MAIRQRLAVPPSAEKPLWLQKPRPRAEATAAMVPEIAGANVDRLRVGDRLPLILTSRDLRRALGFGRTKFSEMERAGAFDHLLRANLVPGQRLYSGTAVAALLNAAPKPEAGSRRAGAR